MSIGLGNSSLSSERKTPTTPTKRKNKMSLNLPKVIPGDLNSITPIILGGAVFNTQFNAEPEKLPATELLTHAFSNGINAIDTSPYYGPSETIFGKSLDYLINEKKLITRDNIFICTKVGRIQLDDFDYSPEWVRKSILRSLERFKTDYLDVVYLHDCEFVSEEGIFAALETMMDMKKQGLIKNVGISGYPVDFLYKICKAAISKPSIGPLDLILSYCNMCLQNTTLLQYYDKFITDCQLKAVNNGSILSMSMLTNTVTRAFHPAPQNLKDICDSLGRELESKFNVDIADLGSRFSMYEWQNKKGRTIIGVSNIRELDAALEQYKHVVAQDIKESDEKLFKFSQEYLGQHLNETWGSGIHQ